MSAPPFSYRSDRIANVPPITHIEQEWEVPGSWKDAHAFLLERVNEIPYRGVTILESRIAPYLRELSGKVRLWRVTLEYEVDERQGAKP